MGADRDMGTSAHSESRVSESDMPITFYLGTAAVEFKQYAAYVQRRTATRTAQLTPPPD